MNVFDIVLVSFPFSDMSGSKLRPALVVAAPGGDNLILVQISTKLRTRGDFEVDLLRKHTKGDIRFDSQIYVDMMFTLHKQLIQKTLGSIQDESTCTSVKSKILRLFTDQKL